MLDEAKLERLRRLVDEVLLTERDAAYSVTNVFAHVGHRAESEGISLRSGGGGWNKVAGAVILEYWWRLVRLGLVSIPGAQIGGTSGPHDAIPAWHLSTYGRELLQ